MRVSVTASVPVRFDSLNLSRLPEKHIVIGYLSVISFAYIASFLSVIDVALPQHATHFVNLLFSISYFSRCKITHFQRHTQERGAYRHTISPSNVFLFYLFISPLPSGHLLCKGHEGVRLQSAMRPYPCGAMRHRGYIHRPLRRHCRISDGYRSLLL